MACNGTFCCRLKLEVSRPKTEQYRTCVYCASTHPVSAYRKHLVIEHSHRLFHCEECHNFVDRKDFVVHMTFHALHYTGKGITRKKFKIKEDVVKPIPRKVCPVRVPECVPNAQSPQCPPKIESSQCAPNTDNAQTSPKTHAAQYLPKTKSHTQYAPKIECKPMHKTEDISAPALIKTKTSVQENDFSDHSDMDGFEPLPESVFKAIEDSQDGQHLANNTTHTPENQPHNEESKIYSKPENNPLSPLAPSVEKKYNNCSVVIEPININNCAQINIAIKNSKLNLALPDNKTPPKTTDASISDKHPPERKAKKNQNIRKCPFCPKECRAASSYYYHLKYFHKESKEHKCEVCGRKFNTRSCLTQHMATHTAHYDYECQQCPKQFKTKAALYIHEQTHSGKKLSSCSQCERAFRWNTQLQRHLKRHAAEKDHVCDTCGRGFNVRSDLLRHARTHSAGNFTCDKCGQKFAQLRYLKVHTKKQHSNNVKETKDSSNGTHTRASTQ